ncbi:Crp/Fnr family transcriptional regulator [Mangrovicella endophytica]|uniref:Crp/Fnr family transcriptional regulator n=1 Tax=Mangrovicella endophytica TaxID=2066697 RepID=UPI000C9E7F3D|nr:Crp/Fnr family transcriptional regulator [Mangrovicella endophytica]
MQSGHHGLERFLKRLLLNSALSEAEQSAILSMRATEVQVAARDDLVMPGETVDQSTLTVEGCLGRFDLMRNGARQITSLYIPGDMCDLYSVVAPTTGWGITALGPATILHVPHADLRSVATEYPNLAFAFWRDTTLDASILAKWIANMGRKQALARVAHLLCELGVRMERAELGERREYRLKITQEQIADAMGLTSVHVNRSLQQLRARNLIVTTGSLVSIPDWDRLTELAEFVPTFLLAGEAKADRPS